MCTLRQTEPSLLLQGQPGMGMASVQFQPHIEFWLVLRSPRLKRNKALRGETACKHGFYVRLHGKCSLQMRLVNESCEKGPASVQVGSKLAYNEVEGNIAKCVCTFSSLSKQSQFPTSLRNQQEESQPGEHRLLNHAMQFQTLSPRFRHERNVTSHI